MSNPDYEKSLLMSWLGNVQYTLGNTVFYNPKVSMMTLDISLTSGGTGGLQIALANSLIKDLSWEQQRNHTGKKYAHESSAFFTVGPIECDRIMSGMKDVLQGTYQNPDCKRQNKPEDMKYINAITITHFVDGAPSKMILDASRDGNNNITGSLRLQIIPPQGGNAKYSYYILRAGELKIFIEMCKKCIQDLPYHLAFANGLLKALKQVEFKTPYLSPNANSNGNGNGQGGNWNPQQRQQPQQYVPGQMTVDGPPPTSPAPAQRPYTPAAPSPAPAYTNHAPAPVAQGYTQPQNEYVEDPSHVDYGFDD